VFASEFTSIATGELQTVCELNKIGILFHS